MNFDKFGFYKIGNYKTYSKFEAMELEGLGKTQWIFNDNVFSSFNWEICPEQPINYFYDKRAQQIREHYDYVVLFYSGGYDSHNILKTFIDNNIHIDEIITTVPSLDILSPFTIEYNLYTKKRLEKYLPFLKNTKIRLVEYKEMMIDMLRDKNDLLYEMNTKYALYNLINQKFKENLHEHSCNVNAGRKVVYIFGMDKPQVDCIGGKYYTSFNDYIIANKVPVNIQRDGVEDISYEFFYWDPSCVPLLIKQAHILKNFLKINGNRFNKEKSFLQIYPRCIEDAVIGYFDAAPFRNMYHNLYLKNNVNEIMCGGGRDYWFYVKQDEIVNSIKSSIKYMQDKVKTNASKQFKISYCVGN
jgi:hypothetical protein